MTPSLRQFRYLAWIAAIAFCASCQRHLAVTKNEYKQYGIDAQTGEDSSVVKYYLPYKEKMQAEMSKVIGQTDQELTKPSTPETLMGNYFADAMLTEGLKKDPTIQFTLSTKGGLRTTFPKGDITVSNVFELMPFENEMVTLKLSGENVQQVIDFIAKKEGEPISGMRMKIKNGVAYDVTIAGQPFDKTKTYNLLTYDYLADGGDELECLRKPIERKEINKKVREALLDNINDLTRQGKKVTAQLDGRIVIVKE
ncbi:5'-nucleotidase C-terminal domain-containing protein [Dyadobacter fanqingshengii]|uniref:5'-nucleotidase C-terminal domain-containing protein n=1 Tax=Dyadobacter fanqingshengii TaxID=2906443 RepID=A0A9X1P922_9BACT|nr:5'-nucleotidase [Dyadobacter fanqingshengii]MCF0040929.1 5'-nucleotidase C-terminal domain-containing protein [Dyadobacter fanqingshengii]USJ37339.1 5'-nucleotidase C-terminal domain-containing protein [Dyadobacter fanqingshengii]